MKKIIIIGAGAMGSAFAVPCLENQNDVTLVGTHLEDELINNIKSKNNFHPALNIELPSKLKVEKFEKLSSILERGADIIVAGISSIGIKWFVDQISKNYKTNLPIILDPSHAMGYAYGVPVLSRACVAMGIDGLLIEAHRDPSVAKSDASQQLTHDGFRELLTSLRPVAASVGYSIV